MGQMLYSLRRYEGLSELPVALYRGPSGAERELRALVLPRPTARRIASARVTTKVTIQFALTLTGTNGSLAVASR